MIKVSVTVYRGEGDEGDFLVRQGPSFRPADSSSAANPTPLQSQSASIDDDSSNRAPVDLRDKPLATTTSTNGSGSDSGSKAKKAGAAKGAAGRTDRLNFSPANPNPNFTSIYELERQLRNADIKSTDSLKIVFDLVDEKDAAKILSSSIECDAIFLLLSAVYSYYKLINQPLKTIFWYKQFSKAPKFALVKSLFSAKQQSDVTEMLSYLLDTYKEHMTEVNGKFDSYSC